MSASILCRWSELFCIPTSLEDAKSEPPPSPCSWHAWQTINSRHVNRQTFADLNAPCNWKLNYSKDELLEAYLNRASLTATNIEGVGRRARYISTSNARSLLYRNSDARGNTTKSGTPQPDRITPLTVVDRGAQPALQSLDRNTSCRQPSKPFFALPLATISVATCLSN